MPVTSHELYKLRACALIPRVWRLMHAPTLSFKGDDEVSARTWIMSGRIWLTCANFESKCLHASLAGGDMTIPLARVCISYQSRCWSMPSGSSEQAQWSGMVNADWENICVGRRCVARGTAVNVAPRWRLCVADTHSSPYPVQFCVWPSSRRHALQQYPWRGFTPSGCLLWWKGQPVRQHPMALSLKQVSSRSGSRSRFWAMTENVCGSVSHAWVTVHENRHGLSSEGDGTACSLFTRPPHMRQEVWYDGKYSYRFKFSHWRCTHHLRKQHIVTQVQCRLCSKPCTGEHFLSSRHHMCAGAVPLNMIVYIQTCCIYMYVYIYIYIYVGGCIYIWFVYIYADVT